MPGVTDLNQLMLKASPDTMQGDINAINNFAKRAQSQISKLADQVESRRIYNTYKSSNELTSISVAPASRHNSGDAVGDDPPEYEDEWDTIDATGPMANLAVAA
jgi:hypothetical protein